MAEPATEDPAAEPVEAPPRRAWVRRGLLGMVFGLLIALSIPVAWVWPYFRDDYVLDGVVRAVALDWRDFGRDKAQARLEYELDHQGIGMWVGDDDCRLEVEGDLRRVRCAWTAVIVVPFSEVSFPLSFASVAGIDASGDLVP